jgi:hypothetical protein
MSQPQVKWIGVAGFVEAAKRTLGDEGWQEVMAALPADTRALLDAPPAAISWVDAAHAFALHEGIVAHAGGRMESVREIARSQVEGDLRGIYRLFVRMATPDFLAQRAASLYGSYWRDHGRVRAERSGPRSMDIIFEDLPHVRLAFVNAQLGGIQAAFEASGLAGVRVTVLQTSDKTVRARATWS